MCNVCHNYTDVTEYAKFVGLTGHIQGILKTVRRRGLTSPDKISGESKSSTKKLNVQRLGKVWYSQHIFQWDVQREFKMSGEGLVEFHVLWCNHPVIICSTLQVSVSGRTWLKSGPTWFRVNGKTCSTGNHTLTLHGVSDGRGIDNVGPYSSKVSTTNC